MRALVVTVVEPDLIARPSVLRVCRPGRSPSAQTPARLAAVRMPVIAAAVDPERHRAAKALSLSDLQEVPAPARSSNWTPSPPDRILRGTCRLGGLAAPEGSELV